MMKYLVLFILSCILFSCKKDVVETYSGDDGIAFYISRYEPDSLSYSFGFAVRPKESDTVFLKMRVVGAVADHPRVISVKAGTGTTAREGIDYKLPEITLPAGALTVNYPVVLLNSPEMLNNTYRLVVEVGESKDLKPGATGTEIGTTISLSRMAIAITGQLVKPGYWMEIESAFGEFSVTKIRFMMEVTGLTDFSYAAIGTNGYYNLPVKLRNALEAYEALNGPLIDENGNEVVF